MNNEVQKVIIFHDGQVYRALKKQIKTNRRLTAFSIFAAVCIVGLAKRIEMQEKRIDDFQVSEGEK